MTDSWRELNLGYCLANSRDGFDISRYLSNIKNFKYYARTVEGLTSFLRKEQISSYLTYKRDKRESITVNIGLRVERTISLMGFFDQILSPFFFIECNNDLRCILDDVMSNNLSDKICDFAYQLSRKFILLDVPKEERELAEQFITEHRFTADQFISWDELRVEMQRHYCEDEAEDTDVKIPKEERESMSKLSGIDPDSFNTMAEYQKIRDRVMRFH